MIPRALCGRVKAMARPSRPAKEERAVRAAAAEAGLEMPSASAASIAREIARRVTEATIADIEHRDELSIALAELKQRLLPTPITTLATCPEIDTATIYLERRVSRLRARLGRYQRLEEDSAERRDITREMQDLLFRRYATFLRKT